MFTMNKVTQVGTDAQDYCCETGTAGEEQTFHELAFSNDQANENEDGSANSLRGKLHEAKSFRSALSSQDAELEHHLSKTDDEREEGGYDSRVIDAVIRWS